MNRLIPVLCVALILLVPRAAASEEPPTEEQMRDLRLACQVIQVGNEESYTDYECLTTHLPDLLNHLHWIHKFPVPPCGLWENRYAQTLWFAGVVAEHSEYFMGGLTRILDVFPPPDIERPKNTCIGV